MPNFVRTGRLLTAAALAASTALSGPLAAFAQEGEAPPPELAAPEEPAAQAPPEIAPEPAPEPQPVEEPAPAPEPEPAPAEIPAPEPEIAPAEEPAPQPAPAEIPAPEPEIAPAEEPAPEPAPAEEPAPAPIEEPAPVPEPDPPAPVLEEPAPVEVAPPAEDAAPDTSAVPDPATTEPVEGSPVGDPAELPQDLGTENDVGGTSSPPAAEPPAAETPAVETPAAPSEQAAPAAPDTAPAEEAPATAPPSPAAPEAAPAVEAPPAIPEAAAPAVSAEPATAPPPEAAPTPPPEAAAPTAPPAAPASSSEAPIAPAPPATGETPAPGAAPALDGVPADPNAAIAPAAPDAAASAPEGSTPAAPAAVPPPGAAPDTAAQPEPAPARDGPSPAVVIAPPPATAPQPVAADIQTREVPVGGIAGNDANVQVLNQTITINSVTDIQGTRIEAAPTRVLPPDVQVFQQVGDREILTIGGAAAAGAAAGAAVSYFIRSNDDERLSRDARDVYVEELPFGQMRETVVRPNGVQVVTISNRYGDVVQRSRILPDGREVVLFYDPYTDDIEVPSYDYDVGADLPPLELSIPEDRYIVDVDVPDEDLYFDTMVAPPVETVERIYSVDEVRRSSRIREKVRRIDLNTINFAFGSAEISQEQVSNLQALADAVSRVLADNPGETFLLEGHTDAVGSNVANLALSDRRAEAVATALTDFFEIPAENLITQGYGEEDLKVDTQGESTENRRVTLRRITALVKPVESAQAN